MKKSVICILIIAFAILLLNSCAKKEVKPAEKAQIANPASVNCVNNGGKLKIMENSAGQYGVCILPDGTECEEWKYFRKECPTNQINASCYQQGTDCCRGYGENISCIDTNIDCTAGYEQKFLGCDLEKCMPKWDCYPISEKDCDKNEDCACGTNIKTGKCFVGNKKYVNVQMQCPDFCSWMAPNGTVGTQGNKCINNKCQ